MREVTNNKTAQDWMDKHDGNAPQMDFIFEAPFDSSMGVGCVYDGQTFFRKRNVIELKIDSWIGYSAGARHMYGKIYVPGLNYKFKGGGIGSIGGASPDYISGWKIDVTKLLTQKDLDLDNSLHEGDRCFELEEVGDRTTKFEEYDEKLLKETAKAIFDKWFTGDWEFKIEEE